MKDTIEINYDLLIEEYDKSLHEKLRNFTTGHDFLETWVPDDNLEQSLLGIFEAAQLHHLKEGLRIRLGRNNSRLLKEVLLRAQAREFGEARVELQSYEKVLHFQAKEAKGRSHTAPANAPVQTVIDKKLTTPSTLPIFGSHFPSRRIEEAHPAYRDSLRALHGELPHQGELETDEKFKIYTEKHSGVRLSIAIDDRTHIVAARFLARGELETALMEGFCQLLLGLSFQEASDHGVLKLENRLRHPEISLEIPGIITPENTDPMFQVPQTLIRTLFQKYKSETDQETGRNFWTDKISKAWLAQNDEERLVRLRQATNRFCQESGLDTDFIQVQTLQNDTRVIVDLAAKPKKNVNLLQLEKHLREQLEPQLEVLLGERPDTNKPREQKAKSKDLSG